jgi:antitoxin (DNA-binding transcriptional repressor) of toxin-antitoxin stability system
LSTLLRQVEQGEEIVISRAGVPVARLVPFASATDLPGYGSLKGQVFLAEDWDSDETNDAIAWDFGVIG